MMKQRTGFILMSAALLLGLLLPLPANAIDVQVGYADNLRPSPFFPTPFFGDASVALFAGQNPTALQLDAGAIRIFNDTAVNFVITSLDVKMRNGAGTDYNLWASFLGAGFTLLPGKSAIFTQTAQFNFDSSDADVLLGTVDPLNNCSIGAAASTPTCLNNPALVILNGTTSKDTGHVLDTGGYDSVNSNPCIGGNNVAAGNTPGNCNESLQWRDIGTTGVGNPGGGGNVPEPATLLLLASGLGGLFVLRYRKQI